MISLRQTSGFAGSFEPLLLEIRKKLSVPLVVITHDPADVEVFADTLVVFEDGGAKEVRRRKK